jgi:hypothetical protein
MPVAMEVEEQQLRLDGFVSPLPYPAILAPCLDDKAKLALATTCKYASQQHLIDIYTSPHTPQLADGAPNPPPPKTQAPPPRVPAAPLPQAPLLAAGRQVLPWAWPDRPVALPSLHPRRREEPPRVGGRHPAVGHGCVSRAGAWEEEGSWVASLGGERGLTLFPSPRSIHAYVQGWRS